MENYKRVLWILNHPYGQSLYELPYLRIVLKKSVLKKSKNNWVHFILYYSKRKIIPLT